MDCFPDLRSPAAIDDAIIGHATGDHNSLRVARINELALIRERVKGSREIGKPSDVLARVLAGSYSPVKRVYGADRNPADNS